MTLRRGRPLRQQSEKAAAREAEHRAATAERRKLTGGLCEGATPACPQRPHRGDHGHHVARRSQGGGNTVENIRLLCWDGHDWVHRNVAEARTRGLLA